MRSQRRRGGGRGQKRQQNSWLSCKGGRCSLGESGEEETGHSRGYLYEVVVNKIEDEEYHLDLDTGTWIRAHIHELREGLSQWTVSAGPAVTGGGGRYFPCHEGVPHKHRGRSAFIDGLRVGGMMRRLKRAGYGKGSGSGHLPSSLLPTTCLLSKRFRCHPRKHAATRPLPAADERESTHSPPESFLLELGACSRPLE